MSVNPASPNTVLQSPTLSSNGIAVEPVPHTPGRAPHDEFTHTPYDGRPNVEDDLTRPVYGYPKLVKLIIDHPGFEAFQSFKDLNIKSLLYYQDELQKLRRELHKVEWTDYQNEPFEDAAQYCLRPDMILQGGTDAESEDARRQYDLIKKIRKVLKEYNAALIQYSQISAFPEADSFNVNSLRTWLNGRDEDKRIEGPGAVSWGDISKECLEEKSLISRTGHLVRSFFWPVKEEKTEFNLIVPRARSKADGLARWVAKEFVPWWQCLKDNTRCCTEQGSVDVEEANPQDSKSISADAEPMTINEYHGRRMVQFTSFIATIVACLLPTVAIAILAQLHTIADLLGLIAVLTAIFAGGLMLLVDSGTSRVEIFTATAAFSAVMVVFVQNQNSAPYLPVGTSLAPNKN